MKTFTPILFLIVLCFACSGPGENKQSNSELIQLQADLDSLKQLLTEHPTDQKNQIATFLTFQKQDAEEAMNFYIGLFEHSKIIDLKRWGKGEPGKEGTIMHATFRLNGNLFMCSDSPPVHAWGFTPAVSNFVECADQSELERLFAKLSENGKIMLPLDNYGFSQRFGFVEDRFGVSWQLNWQ